MYKDGIFCRSNRCVALQKAKIIIAKASLSTIDQSIRVEQSFPERNMRGAYCSVAVLSSHTCGITALENLSDASVYRGGPLPYRLEKRVTPLASAVPSSRYRLLGLAARLPQALPPLLCVL